MIVDEKIHQVALALEQAGVDFGQGVEDANQEACWMVLQSIGEGAMLEPDWQATLSLEQIAQIDKWLQKRIETRLPFAYIIGQTWFAGLPFYIDKRALIPRSFLAEWVQDRFDPWLKADNVNQILDLCSGSGCIGIACAYAWPEAQVTLSDIDANALQVAQMNIDKHELNSRAHIHQGDLFAGLQTRYDLIVCNPPYVSEARMQKLPVEFRFEPEHALGSGQDGLDFTRRLLAQGADFLNPDGALIVEVGSASHALEAEYDKIPFTWLTTEYDEMVVFILTQAELAHYQSYFTQKLTVN